ncbi:hypothetical protein EEB14_20730 [Rhodococcus sp. WS4]|nr:hypothetical protein EEB14_20730 [Rhodococcus sp. WS4]
MDNTAGEDELFERLLAGARDGTVFDLSTDADPDHRDPATADTWPEQRVIPASAIRRILTGCYNDIDPHGLRIRYARITGIPDFENIIFERPLHLENCHIDEPIELSGSNLVQLNIERSHIAALHLDTATVDGYVFAQKLVAHGPVRAVGTHIGGQLILDGAELTTESGDALNLDHATVDGYVFAQKLVAHGPVRAVGARIGGLDLQGAELTTKSGEALILDGATFDRGVFAAQLVAHGPVRALGAHIGELDLQGAKLTTKSGEALNLDHATVDLGVLAAQLVAHGPVRAVGAHIGELILDGAELTSESGEALILDQATVDLGVVAQKLVAHGPVRAVGTHIGGQLILEGAELTTKSGDALNLDHATVDGSVFAAQLVAHGPVRALGARIGGLDLQGAKLTTASGDALNLEQAKVAVLSLTPERSIGVINLTRTQVGDLVTPSDADPPAPLSATGWEVADVHGRIRTHRKTAARWLSTAPADTGFTAHPWHALAAVYDRNGQPADARRLRFTAANEVTRKAPWPTKILRSAYRIFAGHGYYPLLAAGWLLVVFALGVGLVIANRDHFVPSDLKAATTAANTYSETSRTRPPSVITADTPCELYPEYPCFQSFNYALDNVVPAAGAQKVDWTISTAAPLWLTFGMSILRIVAWIFTAILLAGVTGLLRKT